MDCREIKELISACLDGEVSADEARAVEAHLEGCAPCRAVRKRMEAVAVGVGKTEGTVSPDFRERLFARMEREDLLAARRRRFAFSFRWAVVPAAVAAAASLFLIVSRERSPIHSPSPGEPPRMARTSTVASPDLTAEERDVVAHIDLLENLPVLEESGAIDEMEMFGNNAQKRG